MKKVITQSQLQKEKELYYLKQTKLSVNEYKPG